MVIDHDQSKYRIKTQYSSDMGRRGTRMGMKEERNSHFRTFPYFCTFMKVSGSYICNKLSQLLVIAREKPLKNVVDV